MKKLQEMDIYKDLPIKFLEFDEFIFILKKENIHNLQELFNLYDSNYFNNSNKVVIKELKAIIELLKFEYTNEMCINNNLLEKTITYKNINKKLIDLLINMGFTLLESFGLICYFNYYFDNSNMKEIKIIDLLNNYINDYLFQLKEIIPIELKNNLLKGIIIQNIKYKIYILMDYLKSLNMDIEFNKEMALFMDMKNNIQMKANLEEQQILIRKQIDHNKINKTMLKM